MKYYYDVLNFVYDWIEECAAGVGTRGYVDCLNVVFEMFLQDVIIFIHILVDDIDDHYDGDDQRERKETTEELFPPSGAVTAFAIGLRV